MSVQTQIVDRIIRLFGTQEKLASRLNLDQSTISLWKKKGSIPSARQPQIIEESHKLVAENQLRYPLVPDDFFYLPTDERYRGHGEDIEIPVDTAA